LLRKQQPCVREYLGCDRLAGSEEQALPAAVYRPLVPLLNFFMPAQKLTGKTRIGSKEIKVYDQLQSPFRRLSEPEELPRDIKDALAAQCALYNPVELQHSVSKAIRGCLATDACVSGLLR
jgi:hypothetical protein